jgi:hypothetical protein
MPQDPRKEKAEKAAISRHFGSLSREARRPLLAPRESDALHQVREVSQRPTPPIRRDKTNRYLVP